MGRISEAFIDQLNDRVAIADVVGKRVELRGAGRELKGLCPFHDEKTPSFYVSPDKGFYHCFGCGAHGTALGFLMEHDGLPFREAVEVLGAMVGMEIPKDASLTAQDEKRSKLYDVVGRAARWFQEQLHSHPQGRRAAAYLEKRGVDAETIRRFGIGYAPPGYKSSLLQSLGGGEQLEGLLLQAGLLKKQSEQDQLRDVFRDRIIFPIRDRRGRPLAFGGRLLGDGKPKYLNSPETALFHKGDELYGLYECREAVRVPERLLLVEGYMDVLALAQAGIPETCAALGTSLQKAQLRKLFGVAREVVLCFDGDEAGRRAAFKAVSMAFSVLEDDMSLRVLFLPDGEDPDSLVRKVGQAEFRSRIAGALPLSEYFFDALAKAPGAPGLEERAHLASQALPLIDRIPGDVFRTLMRVRLAEIMQISPSELDHILESQTSGRDRQEPAGPEARPWEEEVVSWADSAAPSERRGGRHTVLSFHPKRVRWSRADTAVKLLLLYPDFVHTVPEERLCALRACEREDLKTLHILLDQLREKPDLSPTAVIAEHTGTPLHGELLRLVSAELMLGREEMQREFAEVLEHLEGEIEENHRRELLARIQAGEATPAKIEEHFALKRAAAGLEPAPVSGSAVVPAVGPA